MKVKELIAALREFDQETIVCVYNCDNDFVHYFMYLQEIEEHTGKRIAINISEEQ